MSKIELGRLQEIIKNENLIWKGNRSFINPSEKEVNP
jgi:hypothetical protein